MKNVTLKRSTVATEQLIALIVGTGITVLLGVLGFLGIRTLSMIDENQKKLSEALNESFERLRSVELDLHGLKVEHKINHRL